MRTCSCSVSSCTKLITVIDKLLKKTILLISSISMCMSSCACPYVYPLTHLANTNYSISRYRQDSCGEISTYFIVLELANHLPLPAFTLVRNECGGPLWVTMIKKIYKHNHNCFGLFVWDTHILISFWLLCNLNAIFPDEGMSPRPKQCTCVVCVELKKTMNCTLFRPSRRTP